MRPPSLILPSAGGTGAVEIRNEELGIRNLTGDGGWGSFAAISALSAAAARRLRSETRLRAQPAASDFANSGKVTKAPFGNPGFQNLPSGALGRYCPFQRRGPIQDWAQTPPAAAGRAVRIGFTSAIRAPGGWYPAALRHDLVRSLRRGRCLIGPPGQAHGNFVGAHSMRPPSLVLSPAGGTEAL